jgi:hypothetical protein
VIFLCRGGGSGNGDDLLSACLPLCCDEEKEKLPCRCTALAGPGVGTGGGVGDGFDNEIDGWRANPPLSPGLPRLIFNFGITCRGCSIEVGRAACTAAAGRHFTIGFVRTLLVLENLSLPCNKEWSVWLIHSIDSHL